MMRCWMMASVVLALAACGQPTQQKAPEIDASVLNAPVEMPNLEAGEFVPQANYEARLRAGTLSDRTHVCVVATEGGQVGMRCRPR